MKRILHLIQPSKASSSSLQAWKNSLLDSAIFRYLISQDSEVQRLQQLYLSLDTSYIYQRALALFATSLSFASHEDLISNLRACLQITISYSLYIFDIAWVSRKETISLEKSAIELKETLQSVVQIFDLEHFSLNDCLYHALMIEKKVKLKLVRVSMIRMLARLTITMQSSMIFRSCNLYDEQHARNAMHFLEKLTPRSHDLIEIAFSLVMNSRLQISSISFSLCSSLEEKDVNEKDEFLSYN